ncbi:unnamed protein product [Effrenium voratum]|uniref:Macro domain-containing protein n=1 Tax=Effrenium voratum TaxID=2562239 RepID=A0AA36NC72_9DINO|nr:unnamed protein product [Effrenium voratum]CAJ1446767.1 unnamed protein product [Effrenium voratum]CAJ1449424.1 unnamed protein product [Effrenium voratum]
MDDERRLLPEAAPAAGGAAEAARRCRRLGLLGLGLALLGLAFAGSRVREAAALEAAEVLDEVDTSNFLDLVRVVPYGVLGVQSGKGGFAQTGPEPEESTAIVDPAGLRFVQDLGPAGAGGASGAIYSWLRINLDAKFPAAVRRAIQKEGDAKHYAYGQKQVIHVVGPDFSAVASDSSSARKEAMRKLEKAYKHVLEEFLDSGATGLRMLPVSGGIFAGPFQEELPRMTFASLNNAFRSLEVSEQQRLRRQLRGRLEMCIFAESQVPAFRAACPMCRT